MNHLFSELYLEDFMLNLAEGFDYACNDNGISLKDAIKYFVTSDYSKRIEQGDPFVLSGLSGYELFKRILEEKGIETKEVTNEVSMISIEYWIGYIIAYYMWESNKTFKEIFTFLNDKDLYDLYYQCSYETEEKVIEEIDKIINLRKRSINNCLNNSISISKL